MIKGLIDFLVSTDDLAKFLWKNYVFKIVPMLNPDGVIHGNSWCSLIGSDLNWWWKNPSPLLHPTVFSCKTLINSFCEERELLMYIDFHGHSRQMNSFIYGNDPT